MDKYETEKAAKEHYKSERYELETMRNELVKFQQVIDSMNEVTYIEN